MVQKVFSVIILICTAFGLWQWWSNHKANSFIEQANAFVEKGNLLTKQAAEKHISLFSEEHIHAFPGNRAELAQPAEETVNLLDQVIAAYRSASDKIEEGRKTVADEDIAHYWELKGKHFRKMAEAKDCVRQMDQLFLDKSIETLEQLDAKLDTIAKACEKADQESAALSTEADKFQSDHKDKIE